MVKDFTLGTFKIDSRSAGEKSPSGPIKTLKASPFLILSFFKIVWEFTSANNSLVELSKFFRKSLSFLTSEISGGFN